MWKSVQGERQPPPHPSIIRNPIKEFCEQMAISHRRDSEGEGERDEVGGNGRKNKDDKKRREA